MGQAGAHGGRLVGRVVDAAPEGIAELDVAPSVMADAENIADGVYSPIEGFAGEGELESIVSRGRLEGGLSWTIPILLDLDAAEARRLRDAGDVLLRGPDGSRAVLHVEEAYANPRRKIAAGVFGTTDTAHPGVAGAMAMREMLVSGSVDLVRRPEDSALRRRRLTPAQTRDAFARAGWKRTVAFQTRNPPHVAHEMLQKAALATCDGVFVNPVIGKKKKGDFRDEVIIDCYEAMIRSYYPEGRCLLGTLHMDMRYAGPKEAVHHALIRQNFGCTHMIIGRDHAGVGNFYEPFAAHDIFGDHADLEIEPVFYPAYFYCSSCMSFAHAKSCPHDASVRDQMSGTALRETFQDGRTPGKYTMRPEVAQVVLDSPRPFVDE